MAWTNLIKMCNIKWYSKFWFDLFLKFSEENYAFIWFLYHILRIWPFKNIDFLDLGNPGFRVWKEGGEFGPVRFYHYSRLMDLTASGDTCSSSSRLLDSIKLCFPSPIDHFYIFVEVDFCIKASYLKYAICFPFE